MKKIFCIIITTVFLLTLAACKQTYYKVTFDSTGGSDVLNVEVKEGKKVEKPADPTRNNYSFVCWTLNGNVFDFDNKIEKDITLKARWSNIYTITFDTNGGNVIDSISVNSGETFTAPTPIKEDYIFLGWELNGVPYNFENPTFSNLTLTAAWSYNITSIDKFIELITTAQIKAKLTTSEEGITLYDGVINGNKSLLTGTQDNIFLDFKESSVEVVKTYNKQQDLKDYCFLEYSNDIEDADFQKYIPLYFWDLETNDFVVRENKYINEELNLEISTTGANKFVVSFENKKYNYELKDTIDNINEEIVVEGLISYYVTNTDAIIISENNIQGQFILPSEVKGKEVTQIADEAFLNSKFSSIELSSNILKIGKNSFSNSSLESIGFNNGLKFISDSAFSNCNNLEVVVLPKSVIFIGNLVFIDSNNIANIYLYGNLNDGSITFGENWNNGKTTISNFEGTFIVNNILYKQDGFRAVVVGVYTNIENIVIEEEIYGLEVVRIESLNGLTGTSLTIPSTVKTINQSVFDNITTLTEIICYSDPLLFVNIVFPVDVDYR